MLLGNWMSWQQRGCRGDTAPLVFFSPSQLYWQHGNENNDRNRWSANFSSGRSPTYRKIRFVFRVSSTHLQHQEGWKSFIYYFICVYSLWYLKNTHMNHWQWNVNINLLQVLILLFSSTTFSRPLEIHVYNIMLICIWEFIWFYSISYLLIVLFFF